MTIVRKPASERAVQAVIDKGGAVSAATEQAPARSDRVGVILRLEPELLARIDAAVAARPIRLPRHTWILEALHAQALRESV